MGIKKPKTHLNDGVPQPEFIGVPNEDELDLSEGPVRSRDSVTGDREPHVEPEKSRTESPGPR